MATVVSETMTLAKKATTIGLLSSFLFCLLAIVRNAGVGINKPGKKGHDEAGLHEAAGRRALRFLTANLFSHPKQAKSRFIVVVNHYSSDLDGLLRDSGFSPSTEGEVSTLDFPSNQLEGTIHSALGTPLDLKNAHLEDTDLEGTIHSALGTPLDLKNAHLEDNDFEGTIHSALGTPLDLKNAHLDDNDFEGTIHSALGTPLDLKNAHLDDNDLEGTIHSALDTPVDLEERCCYHSALGTPLDLEELFLPGSSFTGTLPETLSNLDKLNDALFHYTSLEGADPNNVCKQMYQGQLQIFSLDCDMVACECCTCGAPGK